MGAAKNSEAQLTLNVLGLAACADGLIIEAFDINSAIKYPSEANDDKVNYDFINTETGCLISLFGSLL